MKKKVIKKKPTLLSALGVKNKRVYTLTSSQYVFGFILSVSFSMLLGPLFERYAPRYLVAAANGVKIIKALKTDSNSPLNTSATANTASHQPHPEVNQSPTDDPYEQLRREVQQLKYDSFTSRARRLPSANSRNDQAS